MAKTKVPKWLKFQVWDVSSQHITSLDASKLTLTAAVEGIKHLGDHPLYPRGVSLLSVAKDMHGWWVRVPLDIVTEHQYWAGALTKADFHERFYSLLVQARKIGCDYIHIHSDGQVYKDVPVFMWDGCLAETIISEGK